MAENSENNADPLAAFKTALQGVLKDALNQPNDATQEVQRLLRDLDKASSSLPAASVQEVRTALGNMRQRQTAERAGEIAHATCEVALSLGIALRVATKASRTGSPGSRPRYTTEQRKQLTTQLAEAVQIAGEGGITKVDLAQKLNLTANQIKRILHWPEVQNRIARVGQGRNRRYVLQSNAPSSNQGVKVDAVL